MTVNDFILLVGRKVAVKMLGKFEGAKDPSKRQKMIDSEMNAKLVPHLNIVKVIFGFHSVNVKLGHLCSNYYKKVPSTLTML